MAYVGLRFEDRLDGASNFCSWRERIGVVFEEQGVWEFVDNPPATPVDPQQLAQHNKKDAKAKRIILEGVKDHIIPHLSGKKTAKEMWSAIIGLYQGTSEARKLVLRDKLRNIKMAKSESVVSYLTRFTQVKDELAGVGETVPDRDMVSFALLGFPKSWENFIDAVSGREKLPDWERLWSDCVQEEIRKQTRSGSHVKQDVDEENFALAGKGGKPKSKKGSGGAESSSKGHGKPKKDLSKVKCFQCHQLGHYATKCPQRKKGPKKGQFAASTEIEEFSSRFEEDFSFIACMASSVTSTTWFIDSGASCHMTGNKNYFSQLTEKDMQFNIELGDNGKYQAQGIGVVKFERESGKPLYLRDVLYVPGLKKNLVSISVLEDLGYEVFFRKRRVLLKPPNSRTTVQIGVREKTLYKLQFGAAAALNNKKDNQQGRELAELWHRRMGHLHHRALKILGEIATGLPPCSVDSHEVCKGCTLGKYAKTSYPSRDDRAKGILELIHSDVCGPFSSPSLRGFRYYVIFIDDHSRKTWIFFMKNKDEVLSRFVEFKALVENQTSKKIKALRSDNGGEYISNAFRDLCAKEGIKRELTTPHNPQQNGVVERKNRNIVGVAKAMLHDQGLPMFLWAEACNTTVFLQNRSPQRC
jgi:transposase InsO family protein